MDPFNLTAIEPVAHKIGGQTSALSTLKLKRLACWLAVGIGLLAGLHAGAKAQTIKIGVIAPMTGPAAQFGLATAGGPKIVAADINAKGGLEVGGKKYPVEVIAYDDQYKAADAIAAYGRLVKENGVKFVFVMTSPSTVAIKQLAEEDKVMVFTSSVTPKAFDDNTRYMFRLYTPPSMFISPLSSWIRANMKERRILTLNPNDETGWAQTEISSGIFKKDGFEVVGTELYERATKDFAPLLTKILGLKPELIDMGGTAPGTAGLIVRQAREQGFKGTFLQTGVGGPKEIVAAAGNAASEGTLQMLYGDTGNAGYQRIIAEYKKVNNGQEPHHFIVPFVDATNVLLRSIQIAGDVNDTSKIVDSFAKALPMKSLHGDELGLGGKATIGIDHQITTVNYIAVIRNGQPVIVGKVR